MAVEADFFKNDEEIFFYLIASEFPSMSNRRQINDSFNRPYLKGIIVQEIFCIKTCKALRSFNIPLAPKASVLIALDPGS